MRGRLCICTWLLVLHAGVGVALAQSSVTIINPSEARTQWTHSGVLLEADPIKGTPQYLVQYFDYWVDNAPRADLGAYEKVDATTYRHKLPADLVNGAHSTQVRACNLNVPFERKCSDWVVLLFTVDRVTIPAPPIFNAPTNITIITIAVPPTERTKKP